MKAAVLSDLEFTNRYWYYFTSLSITIYSKQSLISHHSIMDLMRTRELAYQSIVQNYSIIDTLKYVESLFE